MSQTGYDYFTSNLVLIGLHIFSYQFIEVAVTCLQRKTKSRHFVEKDMMIRVGAPKDDMLLLVLSPWLRVKCLFAHDVLRRQRGYLPHLAHVTMNDKLPAGWRKSMKKILSFHDADVLAFSSSITDKWVIGIVLPFT